MRVLSQAIIILFGLIMTSACGQSSEEKIIGKWKQVKGVEAIEFFEEGTFTVTGGPLPMGGEYSFVDEDRVKLQFGGLASLMGPKVVTIQFGQDQLVLVDGESSMLHERVPK